MPDPISWYALGRDVNDPQTILEAVDEKILTHNLDPSAHGQSDEAVYNHRISMLLDHVNYSIYNIKLHPETRPIKAFVDAGGAAEFSKIQDAIDYVHALGGGRIFVKAGTYYPKDDVSLYSDIQIEGEDRDTVIFDFEDAVYGFEAVGTTGAHLHNIKLDNIQITQSAKWEDGCILFNYVDDADIVNCKFYDNFHSGESAYSPIVIASCTELNIKGNYWSQSKGVTVANGGSKINIEDNYFYNFNAGAISINAATLVVIRHNYFDTTGDDAVSLAWNKIVFDGNIFINCTGGCINIEDDNNIITNNVFVGNVSEPTGIWSNSNVTGCIITNNRFVGLFGFAIILNSGGIHTIANNIATESLTGLQLESGCNYCSVTGNVFVDCDDTIINSGAGNQLAGNVT